jgi:hypothetical protein
MGVMGLHNHDLTERKSPMTQAQTLTKSTLQHHPRNSDRLPNTDSVASQIVTAALSSCAQKMGLDSPERVIERLQQGNGVACAYCLYSLATQVAASLGDQDDNVRAVYLFEYDATPQDLCFADAASPAQLVRLIVHVSRKTAALTALLATMDHALVQAWARALGRPPQQSLLDAHVIDQEEVMARTGYGVLLNSVHNRPIQIWVR